MRALAPCPAGPNAKPVAGVRAAPFGAGYHRHMETTIDMTTDAPAAVASDEQAELLEEELLVEEISIDGMCGVY